MSRLDAFVAPKPNRALIRTMTGVNRVVMLKGVPGFRDLAPFDRLPGLRGIANVRHIDLPTEDQAVRKRRPSSRPIIPSSSRTG